MKPDTKHIRPSTFSALRLDGAGGAHPLDIDGVDEAISGTGPVWIDLALSGKNGVDWLRNQENLDEQVKEAMLAEETRPRIMELEDGVLTILRGVNLNPGSEAEDMVSVRIWLDANRIITVSRRRLKSLDDIRHALSLGKGPQSPSLLLLDLVDRINDYIGDVVEAIEAHVEQAESTVNESRVIARNSPFSLLRRQTARIRRYLAPQREALERISRPGNSVLEANVRIELREQVNRLTLIIEDLDLVRERAMVAQEEFLGIMAHEQNSKMFLLSVVAAIFLPLSFLTGLMGMNVAGLPGTQNEWAFLILVIIMLASAAAILGLFRFRKWF